MFLDAPFGLRRIAAHDRTTTELEIAFPGRHGFPSEIQFYAHNFSVVTSWPVDPIDQYSSGSWIGILEEKQTKHRLKVKLDLSFHSQVAINSMGSPKEAKLHELLINNPPLTHTLCVAREWQVKPGFPNHGVGDLVFLRPGTLKFLVVEVKHLGGSNHRSSGRKKVREQAFRYGECFRKLHPEADVSVATYTNLDGLKYLSSIDSIGGQKIEKRQQLYIIV